MTQQNNKENEIEKEKANYDFLMTLLKIIGMIILGYIILKATGVI